MLLSEYLDEVKTPLSDVAKQLGISSKTLYNILQGKCDTRLSLALKIEDLTHKNRAPGKGVTCRELAYPYLTQKKKIEPKVPKTAAKNEKGNKHKK